MTHDEASELVPIYALGALDERVAELEEHVSACADCRALLATYEVTTVSLGQALAPIAPPAALRDRVLALLPASQPATRWAPILRLLPRLPRRVPTTAVAALLAITIGLGVWSAQQQAELRSIQANDQVDRRGLALLTSTETTNDRLSPEAAGAQAHGHWFHQKGQQTQVLVVEFMPALKLDEAYDGWFLRLDGSMRYVGRFSPDATGYARLIVLGGDGSDVRRVVVTHGRRAGTPAIGQTVLIWPAP